MSEENKNIELIPYLNKLVNHMDTTLSTVQQTIINVDKSSALRDERILQIQEAMVTERESAIERKAEIVLQIKDFREEYKEKQAKNSARLSILENNFYKWKWVFTGINAGIFIVIFILQIDGLTVATGPWK
jgi:hypothetical protein